MKKITLPWADMFRELCRRNILDCAAVVIDFKIYCDLQEAELNELWENKEKERIRAEKYEKFKAKRNLDKLAEGLRSFKLW